MRRARKNFWLVNKAPSRRRRRAATSGRRKAKRRPPLGFRTWKAYMDSIRPNTKGGTVARRRRRRRNAATANPRRRRRRRRNPATVAMANPRRRHRRRRNPVLANRRRRSYHRRRNPGFSVRGVVRQFIDASKTATEIVGGKAVTRIIRARVLPDSKKGTFVQVAAELGIATALGYASSMALGSRIGANIMAGGYVGAIEALVHQIKVLKPVSDALSDDGNPSTIVVPASQAAAVAGYVADLGGYVPPQLQGIADRDIDSYSRGGVGELAFAGV